MTIGTEFTVALNGDIRHDSGSTNYSVIDLHRWLGDLMDDAQATGDDFLDITDATASARATDNLITLNAPYNIDDTTAEFLFDGSIIQKNGDEIYDGLVVIASAGMYLEIIQDGAAVKSGANNYWTTAYNADAASGFSHRFMIKTRTLGADIDGRRLLGQTREAGFTYSEFRIGTGTSRGNNVLALTYTADLNNDTANATVATWTEGTNTTEGYVGLDVEGTGDVFFYSEYDRAKTTPYSMNQFYERMKWESRRDTAETIYGLTGNLFRGITHEVDITDGTGTWGTPPSQDEELTWTGGSGRLLAVDDLDGTASTKFWMQLLTGVPPTDTQDVTGTSSSATANCAGTATARTISTPFVGASTGSAIIGAYGLGITLNDLTSSDKVFDLTDTLQEPPNQVDFALGGLSTSGVGDRVLVAPLGYYFAFDTEATGPFVVGETLTFSGAGTAYLSELLDLTGDDGFMKVRMLTGVAPLTAETISSSGSGTATVTSDAVVSEDPRQLKLETTLVSGTETEANCTATIPTDTPSSGTFRVEMNTGVYMPIAYTSYTGTTFTFGSRDMSGANTATGAAAEGGNSLYVTYIDKNAASATESFTSVYKGTDLLLFIRVRYGDSGAPIKTFETSGTLSSTGGTGTSIRTPDA
jgi:hypothetical protein